MSRPPIPLFQPPPPAPPPPRESPRCRLTQRVNAYQPRVQPWEMDGEHACGARHGRHACGNVRDMIPRVQPSDSARCRLTQRVNAYQPRVQPWEMDGEHACGARHGRHACGAWNGRHACGAWNGRRACALKERRIVPVRVTVRARPGDATTCGVPSQCGNVCNMIPRALPWAGMLCPVGAGIR